MSTNNRVGVDFGISGLHMFLESITFGLHNISLPLYQDTCKHSLLIFLSTVFPSIKFQHAVLLTFFDKVSLCVFSRLFPSLRCFVMTLMNTRSFNKFHDCEGGQA